MRIVGSTIVWDTERISILTLRVLGYDQEEAEADIRHLVDAESFRFKEHPLDWMFNVQRECRSAPRLRKSEVDEAEYHPTSTDVGTNVFSSSGCIFILLNDWPFNFS